MGSSQSNEVMPAGAHYYGAAERLAKRNGVTGGCIGACNCSANKFVGADDMNISAIADYAVSLNSEVKQGIIKDLIAVGKSLGLLKNETSTDNNVLIKALDKAIPSGDAIKRDPAVHKTTCERIAMAINNAYGEKLIDPKLPTEVVCQQVAEIVHSLATGMHAEFLAVYNDVRNVIKNLSILKSSLQATHDQMMEQIKISDKPVADKIANLEGLHKMVMDEIDRQIKLLENLLNIELLPTEKSLTSLIKSNADLKPIIEKIDVKLGSDKFGQIIVRILKGVGVTADFARIIDNSLKAVGMTMKEYVEEESLEKLKDKIANNAMRKDMDPEALNNYLNNVELLYQNFYRNKDIANALDNDEMKTGRGDNIASMYAGADDEDREGGDCCGGASGGADESSMDKRIKNRKHLRDLIFNTFYRQINELFDQFIGTLNIMSMKVGTDIPLSDQLTGFRHSLQRINEEFIRGQNIYKVLIGYYNDAMSRSKKDSFIRDLQMINSHLSTLSEMSLYANSKQYFTTIASTINSMIELINRYSDEIKTKMGGEEHKCPTGGSAFTMAGGNQPFAISGGNFTVAAGHSAQFGGSEFVVAGEDEFTVAGEQGGHSAQFGGSEFVVAGEDEFIVAGGNQPFIVAGNQSFVSDLISGGAGLYDPPKLYKTDKTIRDAIRKFDYKCRVAQIKQNLAATGKELDHYSAKYEQLVSNSIASELIKEKTKYEARMAELNDPKWNVPTIPAAELEAAKKFCKDQWKAKQNFWATVEAVDSYMQVFTNGLVKDPNAIKEIKAMLDDIEVINDWYDDATGSNITSVFDFFPGSLYGANVNNIDGANDLTKIDDDRHYYEKVVAMSDLTTANNPKVPGNPYLVANPTKGVQACERAKQGLSGLSILKNLLSIFVHIGSVFGGQELRKQIFMTPTQMYNNLMEYLQFSAFVQGFGATIDNADIFKESIVEFNLDTGNRRDTSDVNPGNKQTYDAANRALINIGSSGVSQAAVANPANNADWLKLFRKRFGIWMQSCLPKINKHDANSFKTENEYFVLMMKSIAAKILTVVGMYDVFDRPMEFNGLSPIRMIIGGSDENPKVDSAAVALYLRLPLLAQFYRNIFGFDQSADHDPNNAYSDQYRDIGIKHDEMLKISMVPDVDGVFSGLIKLIFRKNKYIGTGIYSDEDIKELIREINLIYQKMYAKHPKNTITETINEFVNEINRRYGIVTEHDFKEYEKEFGYNYNEYNLNAQQSFNRYQDMPESYPILPGESNDTVQRLSGAQKILGNSFEAPKERSSRYMVVEKHKNLVYNFRCAIDKFFENSNEEYSFNNAIKATQIKLKLESDDYKRVKIISELIRGVDIHNKVDSMKYILFEETVVGGLNTLSAIHSMLARFQQRAQMIDIDFLIEATEERVINSAGLPAVNNTNGIRNHILSELVSKYRFIMGEDAYLLAQNNLIENRQIVSPWIGGIANLATAPERKKFFDNYKATADTKEKRVMTQLFRQMFSSQFMMRELVEALYGIGNDLQGLISYKIEDDKIYLNANGLKTTVEEMFQSVSYFIDLLYPHINNKVMNSYVNKSYPGSYYWLQEHLMDKIIIGRPKSGVENKLEYKNLDSTARSLSRTFAFITQPYRVNANHLPAPNPDVNIDIPALLPNAQLNSFGDLFASIIYYNTRDGRNRSGIFQSSKPNIQTIDMTSLDVLLFNGPPKTRILDTRFAARWGDFYTWKNEFTLNRSLLFNFNQLIAKYIQSGFDSVSGKMYLGLINQFASGAFNQAISDEAFTYSDVVPMVYLKVKNLLDPGKLSRTVTYDDMLNAKSIINPATDIVQAGSNLVLSAKDIGAALSQNGGNGLYNDDDIEKINNIDMSGVNLVFLRDRMDADSNHILFTSLSVILKNIMSSRLDNQSPAYLQENVADVPIYMREKMKANLPAFQNLFKELVCRNELIKRFISNKRVDLSRAPRNNIANLVWPKLDVDMNINSNVNKDRWTGIIDTINKGCNSLITCIEQSLRDVGDDPKYFELHQDFIKDYRMQNGQEPFMPLTSLLSVYKNTAPNNELSMFPVYGVGSDNFKMMYGTRCVFGRIISNINMENVQGFGDIINKYNLMNDNVANVDKSKAETYLGTFIKLNRFVFAAKHIRGLLSNYLIDSASNNRLARSDVDITTPSLYTRGSFVRNNLVNDTGRPMNRINSLMMSIFNDNTIKNCGNDDKYNLPVYSIAKSLSDTIRLTESSLKEEKMRAFVDFLCEKNGSRDGLELQNIVDLNIIPINVHALAREIPLINLYNYAYTFDRLIIELYYGLQNDNARKLIKELCGDNRLERVQSSKDLLVALLINPYTDLYKSNDKPPQNLTIGVIPNNNDVNLFEMYAKGVLTGTANNGELGRPKFLSDQIYNKATFGEMYESVSYYNEMGPAAGEIVRGSVNKNQAAHLFTALSMKIIGDTINNTFVNEPFTTHGINIMYNISVYMISNGGSRIIDDDKVLEYLHNDDLLWNKNTNTWQSPQIRNVILDIVESMVKLYVPIAKFVNKINNGLSVTDYNNLFNEIGALNVNGNPFIVNNRYINEIILVIVTKPQTNSLYKLNPQFPNKKLHWLDKHTTNDVSSMPGVVQGSQIDNINVMNNQQIHSTDVPRDLAQILHALSRLRFDTTFIRNLIFITNLYRSVRMKLARDLNYSKEVITRSIPITKSSITEFYGNDVDQQRTVDYNQQMMNRYRF